MYKCPSCGDGLVFDPKSQKLQCPSCRNQFEPDKVENIKLDQAKETNNNTYETISYKCSHCGAELLTTDETITTFCSFCRTGTMLDRKIIQKTKPDWIIPFKKTKKECEQIYINKISKAFFAPKSMIDTQEVKKIRGIYMPYWIYSFEKKGPVSASGSRYSHTSGNYDYYDDYLLKTDINAECTGITHDATSNFSDRLSESIAPFTVKEKKEFSPAYLSGFYADNEDVNKSVYSDESNEIASEHLSDKLSREKEFYRYGAEPEVKLNEKSAELGLFPVYYLATKNRKGDRISYAVINGQTGKIAADIPIDFGKFAIFSLILTIPLFILLNMFLTITMPQLVTCSIVFNLISLIILIRQNKKISLREEDLDDIGKLSKKGIFSSNKIKKKKGKKNEKSLMSVLLLAVFIAFIIAPTIIAMITEFIFTIDEMYYDEILSIIKYVGYAIIIVAPILMIGYKIDNPGKDMGAFKPIFGLLITIALFCIKPAEDIYYYIAALFSIVLTILSFYNIIKRYNILTTRKLPQLNKRGGDENA